MALWLCFCFRFYFSLRSYHVFVCQWLYTAKKISQVFRFAWEVPSYLFQLSELYKVVQGGL